MKKAFLLGLLIVLGMASVGSAELRGEWDTWLKLNLRPELALDSFYSFLDVQYATCNLTLEAASLLNADGLDAVWFEAYGSVGAFSAWSLLFFNPESFFGSSFMLFQNAAEVSVGGVDFYALFAVKDVYGGLGFIGTGFAIGGIGAVRGCRFGVEVAFNLDSQLWPIFRYGLYGGLTDWTYTLCASDIWYPYWILGQYTPYVIVPTCDLLFSYLTGIAQFPISCVDLYVGALFDCEGFLFLSFLAEDIDVGIDWLKIYGLSVTYWIDEKYVSLWTQIETGDVVCFQPYFTVWYAGESWPDAISLNALTLTCTVLGCQFYWGHLFDRYMVDYGEWMGMPAYDVWGGPRIEIYGFGPLGVNLVSLLDEYPCLWIVYEGDGQSGEPYFPNEVFGVRCDEDSCCGGLFSFALSNFFSTEFDAPVTGIFGWMGSYVELYVGVGSNVNLIGALNVTSLHGVEFITMGVEVAW